MNFKLQEDESIIYIVTNNLQTREIYIGKTDRSLPERKEEHESAARKGDGVKFHNALVNTGFDNWTWEVLEICKRKNVFEREKKYIKKFAASSVEVLNTVHSKREPKASLVLQPKITMTPDPTAESDLYRREAGALKPVINLTTNKEYRSLSEASEKENEPKSTIRNSCNTGKILQNGSRFAWIDLTGSPILKEGHSMDRVIGRSAKKIKNLVTGKVFKNAAEAAKDHDVSQNAISANANGDSMLVRKKWVFCYLDDKGQEVKKTKHSLGLQKLNGRKQVKFIAWHVSDQSRERLLPFKDLTSLCNKLQIKNTSHVKAVCDGKRSHVEKWRVAYADERGNPILKGKHNEVAKKVFRKVICLDDNEIFQNLTEAGRHYQVIASQIGNCAKGKQKSVRWNGKRLRFAYCDENGSPILTAKHQESLDTQGKVRLYHISSGKTYNSVNAFCRATKVPKKRVQKKLNGEKVDLLKHEFIVH